MEFRTIAEGGVQLVGNGVADVSLVSLEDAEVS